MSNEREGATPVGWAGHPRRMNATAFAASALLALPFAAGAATPCDAPEQYVRAAKLEVASVLQAAPLLRPYVVGGIAAVALREEGGQRWLQLAVHSADDARRQLAARASGGDAPAVDTWAERVWLRCPASSRT
jgi:hypothetical protein